MKLPVHDDTVGMTTVERDRHLELRGAFFNMTVQEIDAWIETEIGSTLDVDDVKRVLKGLAKRLNALGNVVKDMR